MNDSTELAQRMKAAALKAKQANDLYLEGKITLSECVVETKDHLDYSDNPNNTLALVEALEAKEEQRANWFHMAEKLGSELDIAEKRIAELERMESTLRPVGVMSQKAYCRLENRESRFIALWPRPEIYLPRKRPDDGVIVFARTAACVAVEGE